MRSPLLAFLALAIVLSGTPVLAQNGPNGGNGAVSGEGPGGSGAGQAGVGPSKSFLVRRSHYRRYRRRFR